MPIITDPDTRIDDLATLHPLARAKVQAVIDQLATEGIPLRVFEAFRTPYRQNYLFTKVPKVTNARAWQSNHQYGCAVDFVFFENGGWHWGKKGNVQHRRWYDRLHEIGRAHGLVPLSWETPHLEMAAVKMADLRAGRYPSGGDGSWADNLSAYIDAWTGSPSAPPKPSSSATPERPAEEDSGGGTIGPAIPQPDTFQLRSRAFGGNAALEAVADGHRLLRPSGSRVEGIDLVQDALNLLATRAPQYRIELGAYRGYFGQKTEQAVRAYQDDFRLTIDGEVGQETMRSLDETMAAQESGAPAGLPPTVAGPGAAPSGYQPPSASTAIIAGVDFSKGDAAPGRAFSDIYAAADADPSRGKGDPSLCKALLKFSDGTVFFEAKMAICADGSPRAKQIDPGPGLTKTAFTYPGIAKGYFDAEDVPYIVLPGGSDDHDVPGFAATLGLKKLDLAVVIYRNKITPAFYGEVGPWFRIGEASIQVHEELPVPNPWTSPAQTRVRNASVERELLYFIFPDTAVPRPDSMTPADWVQKTRQAALARWETFRASFSTIA